ncbi:MAG: TPM domain-containing protein, partial [Acidobacteria bacterium]|nr:TPM domain-containing protein [Acidobacteriota bacterium]
MRRTGSAHIRRRPPLTAAIAVVAWLGLAGSPSGQSLPALTAPVNDFAGVIDVSSAASLDRLLRSLDAATTDAVVVATVSTVAPYADVREYAVKLFENQGRGIGRKGRDNGILVLLAVKERAVRIEVGYDLESIVTDGFAGETSRDVMVPSFRQGEYGQGLLAGVQRVVARVAEARGVRLDTGTPGPAPVSRRSSPPSVLLLIAIYVAFVVL